VGYKLGGVYGTIPAGVRNKTLRLRFGTAIKEIPISTGDLEFPEQCNFVSNPEICCFLENEDYRFIMWQGGFVNVVSRWNGVLRGQTTVKGCDEAFGELHVALMGGYRQNVVDEIIPVSMLYASDSGDNVLFFSEGKPTTLCMQVCQKMRQRLLIESGEALWPAYGKFGDGKYWFRDRGLNPILLLEGEYTGSKGFICI